MSWSDMNATTQSKLSSGKGSAAASASSNLMSVAAERAAAIHRRRAIDADDRVAQRPEVPGEPSLAATEVERRPAGSRDELEEEVAVKAPVAVVPGGASPGDPVGRLRVPRRGQVGPVQPATR